MPDLRGLKFDTLSHFQWKKKTIRDITNFQELFRILEEEKLVYSSLLTVYHYFMSDNYVDFFLTQSESPLI